MKDMYELSGEQVRRLQEANLIPVGSFLGMDRMIHGVPMYYIVFNNSDEKQAACNFLYEAPAK